MMTASAVAMLLPQRQESGGGDALWQGGLWQGLFGLKSPGRFLLRPDQAI
jgi:hypothetical protein